MNIHNNQTVGLYRCDLGYPYIVFQSGIVMYNPDDDEWIPSRIEALVVKEHFDFEGFIPAPCAEAL